MSWTYDTSVNPNGYGLFWIKVWNTKGDEYDVTYLRGVPTVVENMTFADPFGDATAVLKFAQVTGFDGVTSLPWLKEFTNVDIYWLPCTSTQWNTGEQLVIDPITNQRTLYLHEKDQLGDPILPMWEGFFVSLDPSPEGTSVTCQGCLYQLDRYFAKPLFPWRPKTVESMIARYFDPRRRGLWTQPLVIEFGDGPYTDTVPDSKDCVIRDGEDWTRRYTVAKRKKYRDLGPRYVPTGIYPGGTEWDPDLSTYVVKPDPPFTGFVTRNSGSWEKALTGYIQGQLSILYTKSDSSTALMKGDQWTITKDPGRIPRLYVRKQTRVPDLVCWYGQPGVEVRVNRDGNQASNVVFGNGRGMDDTSWTTVFQPDDAPWSAWEPLASIKDVRGINVYHYGYEPLPTDPDIPELRDPTPSPKNPAELYWSDDQVQRLYDGYEGWTERTEGIVVAERMAQFPDGINLADAQEISENWLERDKDPGWSGEITIQVDLRDSNGDPVCKWDIRAGMCILVKGFNGFNTEEQGINKFHISQVNMNPQGGSVSLTVDTKFRDLLTVEEAIASGRDTLTPIKALQVNKRSVMIDDLVYPWNNTAGSGYFPRSQRFTDWSTSFPHLDGEVSTLSDPPSKFYKTDHRTTITDWPNTPRHILMGEKMLNTVTKDVHQGKNPYVAVHAGDADQNRRWAFMPMLLAQAGSINRTEFAAYYEDGTLAPVEFHVSFYYVWNIDRSSMPLNPDTSQHAALFPNAFESRQPNGNPWPNPDLYAPRTQEGFIIGWGTYERPAGYSPRMKDGIATPTGMMVDGAGWSFDFSGQNKDFNPSEEGKNRTEVLTGLNGISIGVALYAQFEDGEVVSGDAGWIYVKGRAYRDLSTR
jgi:hypothetical protein